ncbi:MAG: phosphotransferase family protein [Thermomicrobiales bacterium]
MDLTVLAERLRASFPGVPIVTPLSVLGEGFDSVVVETANGIVFRIAKHVHASWGRQREGAVLSVVQRHVRALNIPLVRHDLDESDAFPYGVIGYEKLPGRPLRPDDIDHENRIRIAGQVAGFLTELHSIDIRELSEIPLLRFPPSRERLVDLGRNVSAYLAQHLSRNQYQEFQRWWADLLDYSQRYSCVLALIHGDLWYENMLFDEQQRSLVGVIDFTNVSIGDSAIDLATQRYMGDRFAGTVIDNYYRGHVPTDLTGRINALLGLRELLGLEHGILTNDVDEEAVSKVNHAMRIALS